MAKGGSGSLPVFLPEAAMNIGKMLFAQLMDFIPWKAFHRIVDRHDGDRHVKPMTCADQFRVMAFAQLTYRESLRNREIAATRTRMNIQPKNRS